MLPSIRVFSLLFLLSASVFYGTVHAETHGDMEFSDEIKTRQQLVQVALAREPADLIIRGATVLNMFTSKWQKNQDIVIKGKRIAWTGDAGAWSDKSKKIHDASGLWAIALGEVMDWPA